MGAAVLLGACGAAEPADQATPPTAPTRVASPAHVTSPVSASRPASPAARSTASPLARRAPITTPCTGNSLPKYVFVSLAAQRLWMCARRQVAFATPITSGMTGEYTETPTGTFTIQGRDRNTVLTLADGQQYDVNYWIPFQAPLFGFHDAPWQHFPYGSPKYRTDGSHGCVHLPLAAIAFLYAWAPVGTPVRIAA